MPEAGRPEPPPFGGSWKRLFLGVVVWLAAMILLFWVFTEEFTP